MFGDEPIGNDFPPHADPSSLTTQTSPARTEETTPTPSDSGFEAIGNPKNEADAGDIKRTHREEMALKKLEHKLKLEIANSDIKRTEIDLKKRKEASEIESRRAAERRQEVEQNIREKKNKADDRFRLMKFLLPLAAIISILAFNSVFNYRGGVSAEKLARINENCHTVTVFLIGLFAGNAVDVVARSGEKKARGATPGKDG